MNRRKFLTGLAAFAAAPIAPIAPTLGPVAAHAARALAISDVITPGLMLPYMLGISERIGMHWRWQTQAEIVRQMEAVFE